MTSFSVFYHAVLLSVTANNNYLKATYNVLTTTNKSPNFVCSTQYAIAGVYGVATVAPA